MLSDTPMNKNNAIDIVALLFVFGVGATFLSQLFF